MRSHEELLSNLALSLDEVFKLEDATINNELIAQYYEAMQLNSKAENVRRCGRSLFFNEYKAQAVFDLQNVFLCHDPFCINCQRYKGKTWLLNYTPVIEKAKENYDLYHLVQTQKNCFAETYRGMIKRMATAYKQFINYLTGHTKIKGLDFSYLGYGGAIRAFESTFTETEYHPHFHNLLALSKDLFLQKNTLNDYSDQYKTVYENGKKIRKKITRRFCELEIIIQKIWYLLMNNQEVTLKAINDLDLGYSCTLDKADDKSVLEVFKYAIKSFGEDSKHLTFEQFATIQPAIKGFRTIECYGIFRKNQLDESIDQQLIMHAYDEVIAALELKEKPVYNVYKSLYKVKEDIVSSNAFYINRRALFHNAMETNQNLSQFVGKILQNYNDTHHKRIEIDDFYEKVMQKGKEREIVFNMSKQSKKDKIKKYTERSKARTKYAKQKLREQGKSPADPRYAQDFFKYKVEYNNLHPLPRNNVIGELPF